MEPIAREYWEHQPGRGGTAITGTYNPTNVSPFACPVHWHDFIELLFLRDGEAVVTVGQAEFRVQPGDILCINPNEPHAFQSRTGASFGVVQFTLELLASGQRDPAQFIHRFTSQRLFPSRIPRDDIRAPKWQGQLQDIIRLSSREEGMATLRAMAIAFELLVDLVDHAPDLSPPSSPISSRDIERLYLLQDFVRLHLTEEISLHDAADIVHVSRPHLCRLLKQWTGHTFTEYLREVRITRAQHLLRTTTRPITFIATEVGYTSPTAFDRAFRVMNGLSPREYRYSILRMHDANSS